jgi:hypothetical protein
MKAIKGICKSLLSLLSAVKKPSAFAGGFFIFPQSFLQR